MTLRPTFVEHQTLSPLHPHLQSYFLKGLQEMKQNGKTFKATAEESYAADVLERVGELDNSVKSLRLAMSVIVDLKDAHQDASDVYRYHYENFLLRLTGIEDRAHRLVGVALLLDLSKVERIGGNQFVVKHVKVEEPEVYECLKTLTAIAAKHKTTRNEIAHSKAFSTRELGLFSAVESLNFDTNETIDIAELVKHYVSRGGRELAELVAEVVAGIEALLEALAPSYGALFSRNIPPSI